MVEGKITVGGSLKFTSLKKLVKTFTNNWNEKEDKHVGEEFSKVIKENTEGKFFSTDWINSEQEGILSFIDLISDTIVTKEVLTSKVGEESWRIGKVKEEKITTFRGKDVLYRTYLIEANVPGMSDMFIYTSSEEV